MTEAEISSTPIMASSTSHEQEGFASSSSLPAKKKRSLPGMPDPSAEVIALSPTTLLATNRFVCEICNKGFQRDQNLQLHRRGHNLPWKLRQRASKEVKIKKVYVCPEATCVHHEPSRALGDLTGIKKHFSRKHGEKKYACERCSKKYAVQSDWKAHVKTCGTREYRCDCGTLFSRRDSFITHRAFCDALAQETAKSSSSQPLIISSTSNNNSDGSLKIPASTNSPSSPPTPPLTPSTGVMSPVLSIQSTDFPKNHYTTVAATTTTTTTTTRTTSNTSGGHVSISDGVFASVFASSISTTKFLQSTLNPLYMSNSVMGYPLSYQPPVALSATALLQKAVQMGAKSSGSSLLRDLELGTTNTSMTMENNNNNNNHPTTLDFLGLGGVGTSKEASSSGFSSFFTSMGSDFVDGNDNNNDDEDTWDDTCERKPSLL